MRRDSLAFCLLLAIISSAYPADTLYHHQDPGFLNDLEWQSNTTLDFSCAGSNQPIATFVVNSNAAAGFQITFQFANGGIFSSGTGSGISMTSLTLHYVSGTLGSQLTQFDQGYNILQVVTQPDAQYVWNPAQSAKPQTKTANYTFQLRASWNTPARMLKGIYLEQIKATIDTTQ
jgi:hypothetical protein